MGRTFRGDLDVCRCSGTKATDASRVAHRPPVPLRHRLGRQSQGGPVACFRRRCSEGDRHCASPATARQPWSRQEVGSQDAGSGLDFCQAGFIAESFRGVSTPGSQSAIALAPRWKPCPPSRRSDNETRNGPCVSSIATGSAWKDFLTSCRSQTPGRTPWSAGAWPRPIRDSNSDRADPLPRARDSGATGGDHHRHAFVP